MRLPRLRPPLFAVVSALSLGLCLTTSALWLRGFWVGDSFTRESYDEPDAAYLWCFVHSGGGRIYLTYHRITWSDRQAFLDQLLIASPSGWTHETTGPSPAVPPVAAVTGPDVKEGGGLGFRFLRRDLNTGVYTSRCRAVGLPLGPVVLVTAVLPAVWLPKAWRRRRGRRRLAAGLCVRCGYDLRASPGLCPECGSVA